MSLAAELQATFEGAHKQMPKEASNAILTSTADIKASYDPTKATQVGQKFPDFTLSDATGKQVSSASLLAKGAILISFYRGEWCPFCNLELRALQKVLPEFEAKGVTLVAVSPELPDTSLSTKEKLELTFPVLSDVGNKLAKQLGIVWQQPEALRPFLTGFGIDWKHRYGNESFQVPVPATFLVGKDGVVRNSFIDADYTKRLEPQVALAWCDEL